jgi:hypothetical protein
MLTQRFWFWIIVLALVCANLLQWFAIRDLQESRNRAFTYIQNSEALWAKQTTFNREYYFKMHQEKRADKEWPITLDKRTGKWN